MPHIYLDDTNRQRLKALTKAPISWSTGTCYPLPHPSLNTYQTFHPLSRTPLSKASSAQTLIDFLAPNTESSFSPGVRKALSNIKIATRAQDWDPSLAIKALWDIDVAFFDGRLRGNVIVAWGDQRQIEEEGCGEEMEKPEAGFLGLCQPLEYDDDDGGGGDEGGQQQRCKIWLNSDTIFGAPDPRLVMWETVLHELVHAYILITTDRKNLVDYRFRGDPHHDAQFEYLLSMVDRRSLIHLEMPAKKVGKGHTICIKCAERPLMQGDRNYGMDEEGLMLRAQRGDPKWDSA